MKLVNSSAHLSNDTVREMREVWAAWRHAQRGKALGDPDRKTMRDLAAIYGVTTTIAENIVGFKTRQRAGGPMRHELERRTPEYLRTVREVRETWEAWQQAQAHLRKGDPDKKTLADLAAAFDLEKRHVEKIVYGEICPEVGGPIGGKQRWIRIGQQMAQQSSGGMQCAMGAA